MPKQPGTREGEEAQHQFDHGRHDPGAPRLLFAHGVQLNTLLGLLRGVTGLSSKERKEAVVNFMRDEHNVQPLGTQPQYRVALYTPSADGSLQPVDKNGVPFPSSTKETRGHYTFFQGMQVVQEDAES